MVVSLKFYINIKIPHCNKVFCLQHALLKEVFSSSKKESKLFASGGLQILIQSHFFFEIVISEQIVSLYGMSYSFNVLPTIPLQTYSINPPPLQFLSLRTSIS